MRHSSIESTIDACFHGGSYVESICRWTDPLSQSSRPPTRPDRVGVLELSTAFGGSGGSQQHSASPLDRTEKTD
jgi:hypothetical protein